MPAPRAASRSPAMFSTGPSRSQASGDSGSVKPKVMSITTRAGRRPKPPRSPKPCMCNALPPLKLSLSPAVRSAKLVREPLVELAAGLGDHAPLLLEWRERPAVELRQLPALVFELLAPGRRRAGVYGAVLHYDAVFALGGLAADEAPAYVLRYRLGITGQWVPNAPCARGLKDEPVALEDRDVAHLGWQVYLLTARADEVGARAVGAGDTEPDCRGVNGAEDFKGASHDPQAIRERGRLTRAQD